MFGLTLGLGWRPSPGSDGPPLLSLGAAETEDSLRESLQARGRDRLTARLAEAIGPLSDLLLGPGQYPESLDQAFASGQGLLLGHGLLNRVHGVGGRGVVASKLSLLSEAAAAVQGGQASLQRLPLRRDDGDLDALRLCLPACPT